MNLLDTIDTFEKLTKTSSYKTSGIYIVLNKKNNKYYLGSSKQILSRWSQHQSDLRCGRHANAHLQNAYNLYGKDSFSYLIIEATKEILEREQHYLETYKPYNSSIGYNIARNSTTGPGGEHVTRKRNSYRPKLYAANKENGRKRRNVTQKELDKLAEIRKMVIPRVGSQNHASLLKEHQVQQIREMLDLGFGSVMIAKLFKVQNATIHHIKNGATWSHLENLSRFRNIEKGPEVKDKQETFEEIRARLIPKNKQKPLRPTTGVNNPAAKLTPIQVLNVKNMYFLGFSKPSICQALKLNSSTVCTLLSKNLWKEIIPDEELVKNQS